MARLDFLFRTVRQQGSTDLHLAAGSPPKARTRGSLEALPMPAITAEELREQLDELLSDEQRSEFSRYKDVDFTYWIPGVARFRASYFLTQAGPAAVFRLVPEVAVPMESLGLPPQFEALLDRRSGLVLVSAPMGSGRSTLTAALVDRINAASTRQIVSIEDPVELWHGRKRGVVVQREVGRDTMSYAGAVQLAMRAGAEVIVVGDLPDHETVFAALRAAEAGSLVIALPAIPGAIRTMERLVEMFPAHSQMEVRALLADNLLGVLGQVLLRRKDGPARIAAHELVLGTPDLVSALREGELNEIQSVIEAGKGMGMRALDDSLAALLAAGVIAQDEAHRKAIDKSRFAQPS